MTERIDKYLEGALPREALTADERKAADAAESAMDQTRTFLARRAAPDLTAAVMQHVRALEPAPRERRASLLHRWVSAVWMPRRISIRPAYAAVAIIALSVFIVWGMQAERRVQTPGPPASQPRVFVQFRLDAFDAERVQLAGSFTAWQPQYDLHESSPGIWTTMVPLAEGVHDYAFIVDGERWVADPYAAQISDGFGGTNSRLTLLVSRESQL